MAKVMAAFGCIVPIIVDEADKVLAGTTRIGSARLLGLKTVPTAQVTHLNTEQKESLWACRQQAGGTCGSSSRSCAS
jgi:ParB-like chromosome segregation protein Spo0J